MLLFRGINENRIQLIFRGHVLKEHGDPDRRRFVDYPRTDKQVRRKTVNLVISFRQLSLHPLSSLHCQYGYQSNDISRQSTCQYGFLIYLDSTNLRPFVLIIRISSFIDTIRWLKRKTHIKIVGSSADISLSAPVTLVCVKVCETNHLLLRAILEGAAPVVWTLLIQNCPSFSKCHLVIVICRLSQIKILTVLTILSCSYVPRKRDAA